MRYSWKHALEVVGFLLVATQACAQNLSPPPSGLLILDLAGTPIISAYAPYNASFVATSAGSTVTFVFRHDPGYFAFDNAAVVDTDAPAVNLLQNPSFEIGAPTLSGAGVPGWTYFEQAGLADVGVPVLGFEAASPTDGLTAQSGSYFWDDGATGGYDGIDQTIPTTIGDTYDVSFWLAEIDSNNVATPDNQYQQTCTNGNPSGTECNGIDVVVYAGDGLPPTGVVSEPASMGVLGVALGGLALLRRRSTRLPASAVAGAPASGGALN